MTLKILIIDILSCKKRYGNQQEINNPPLRQAALHLLICQADIIKNYWLIFLFHEKQKKKNCIIVNSTSCEHILKFGESPVAA